MISYKKKVKEINFDICIIGAGPAGLAFACGLNKTRKKVVIIEKSPKKTLENPKIDGREIALTHNSANMLKELGVWNKIPAKLISTIKEARVLDGISIRCVAGLRAHVGRYGAFHQFEFIGRC